MRKTLPVIALALCAGSAAADGIAVKAASPAKPASPAVTTAASIAALTTAVNDLSARVSALEATPSLGSLFAAGTYTWTGLQVGQGNRLLETISFNGSINFSFNGTFTYHLVAQQSDLGTGSSLTPTSVVNDEDGSGTWTVSGNALTATTTDGTVVQFHGAASNHILIANVVNNHATGTLFDKQIVILTRDGQLL